MSNKYVNGLMDSLKILSGSYIHKSFYWAVALIDRMFLIGLENMLSHFNTFKLYEYSRFYQGNNFKFWYYTS